jgi:hypothetical protein
MFFLEKITALTDSSPPKPTAHFGDAAANA